MKKTYTIKVIKQFKDVETGKPHTVGELMIVDMARAENIIKLGLGNLISITHNEAESVEKVLGHDNKQDTK